LKKIQVFTPLKVGCQLHGGQVIVVVRTLKRKEMIGEIESNIFEICLGIR
jgi:hypothetical protein